jgi:hypothetical protein
LPRVTGPERRAHAGAPGGAPSALTNRYDLRTRECTSGARLLLVHFQFEQRFSAPPEVLAAAYADPALYVEFEALPKMEVLEVLDHRADGDRVQLRVRSRFAADLPSAARRVLDPSKLTWVEESTHDLASMAVTFRLVPDHYTDRLRAGGSYRFEASGSGSVRRSEGEVVVRYPIVGGKVERAIVSGLEEHLASEVPVVERFLRDQQG